MSSFQLKAQERNKLGSLEARRIKKAGMIPAVIYSKEKNINISLNKREFETEFSKGNILSRVAEIEINGKKIKAIAHRVELDPVSDFPVHIDLIECVNNSKLKANPRINFTNQDKCLGLKKGGFLHIVARKAEVLCDSEKNLIETIDIDIARLQVGQKVRSSQIKLPSGVEFKNKTNFLIASITGRGKAEEEASADAASATTAAGSPAAGATSTTPAQSTKADDKKPAGKK